MDTSLHLYAVSATFSDGTHRVIVLHASDPDDAIYCVREGWDDVSHWQVHLIDDLGIGVMRVIHEGS